MCEYCGCRQVEPIAELMDEHVSLLDLAGDLRRRLVANDIPTARELHAKLLLLLTTHVLAEEEGVFAALKAQGDFADAVVELEGEHVGLDRAFAELDLAAPDALAVLDQAVSELAEHIDKEDLGIFPVAVVTLGATGWDMVDTAREHRQLPA